MAAKMLRKCKNGHQYFKSSDCPTCPICEAERKPEAGFLSLLPAPARRALESNNITTLQELARRKEAEILSFHGMGPSSLPKLRAALMESGMEFKKDELRRRTTGETHTTKTQTTSST